MGTTAQWKKVGFNLPTADIEGLVDGMRDVAEFMNAFAKLLEAIAPFLVFPDDPLKALINALLSTLEALIDDLLNNNIASAIHVGKEYDPTWTFDPKEGTKGTPQENNNLSSKGMLPWRGTGLPGFFGDIIGSMNNPNDPWSPKIESGGEAFGVPTSLFLMVAVIKIVPDFNELASAYRVLEELKKFPKDIKKELNKFDKDQWKLLENNRAAFKDMGSAFASFTADMSAVSTSKTMDMIKKNWDAHDARKRWNQGDFQDKLKMLSENTPAWRSIPVAALLGPPVEELFRRLRKAVEALKFPSEDALKRAVLKLAKRVKQLSDLIDLIADIIVMIDLLWEFLLTCDILLVSSTEGPGGAVSAALDSPDLPSIYTELPMGIVFGNVSVISLDSGLDNVQSFFDWLQAGWKVIKDTASNAASEVTEAWGEMNSADGQNLGSENSTQGGPSGEIY